jgi:hypothetical protein
MPEPRFPELALPALDGTRRPLSEAWSRGRALVAIGHGDCKTTRMTLPYVDRIHQRRAREHGVVAVLQDTPAAAAELKRELGLSLPLLLEADPYPLARALDVVTVPTLLLVEPDGRVSRVSLGFSRLDLMVFAEALGIAEPLFDADDPAPALRPG